MKLMEAIYGDLIKQMETLFNQVSKKYFKDDVGKYPKPKFKIKPNMQSVGLYLPRTNEMNINLDFAKDETALKATVFHESIHYYQKWKFGFNPRLFKLHGYHDDYFHEMAKKINSGEGQKLVTVKGVYSSIKSGKSAKPFWVYVIDKNDGFINWIWSPTKNQKMIDKLNRMKEFYHWTDVFIINTDVIDFKGAPRANPSKRSLPYGMIDNSDSVYKNIKNTIAKSKKIKV